MLSTLRVLAILVMTSFSSAQAPNWMTILLTAYTPSRAETDSDPGRSACGFNRPNQIALSQDLFRKQYHCGDRVRVYRPDTGRWHTYIVWDTMAERKTRQADIMMPTRDQALNFGRRQGRIELP